MDMTYFALVPLALKRRGLKVPIVFNYDEFRFEVWLSAANKRVQKECFEFFSGADLRDYHLMNPGPGVDSILERDLAPGVALDAPEALAATIRAGALALIRDVEEALDGPRPSGAD